MTRTPSLAASSRGKEDATSSHSQEPARELPENPEAGHLEGQGKDHFKAGPAPTLARSALPAAKTVIRWMRWAVLLGLVYCAWTGLLYGLVQNSVFFCPLFLFVAAGAKIAPRNHLTTAIVLAAVLVAHSFWGHVLAPAPEGVSYFQLIILALLGHDRHFTLEALGAVLGVVYIFWSEKRRRAYVS